MGRSKLIRLLVTALMAAAGLLLYFLEIPMFAGSLSFLQFNFSNIPAVVTGVVCGPLYGLAVELIKNLLQFLIKGLSTQGGIGNIMDFLVGSSFTVAFSVLYRKTESTELVLRVLLTSLGGLGAMVLVGAIGNYLFVPIYFQVFIGAKLEQEFLFSYVGAATILNVTKGVMLSIVAHLIPIKQLSRLVR